MEFLYLIITGMFVGLMSSFFGVGGGSLIMPIMYMQYPELPAQAIIPCSLGVIFFNSLINNYNFYREKLFPEKKTIINFAITCALGSALGSYLLHFLNSMMIKKGFGVIIFVIALRVLFAKTKESPKDSLIDQNKIAITGFIGSLISSITGLGGGIVFVPLLVGLVRLPLILISPYSNTAMTFATFIGLIPHFFYQYNADPSYSYSGFFVGHVNFLFILAIFTGALFTTKIGTKLNSKVEYNLKKKLLATLLIIFALKTLI